jgi:hypothetical protein
VAPELEGSPPCSQEPDTGPYPEPGESPPSGSLPKIHMDPIRQSTSPFSKWSLSFGLPHQNLYTFLSSRACHTPCPPHSPWFDLPNEVWGWVQIMKLSTVQPSPFSAYYIPLRSKYSPQHPVLKSYQSSHSFSVQRTKFRAHTKQLAELRFYIF